MIGGVCEVPGQRCYHPIACSEGPCVRLRGEVSSPIPKTFPREAVARKLCEQHGGDPDAVATEEHDCWEGPLWTAFVAEADAIAALLQEDRQS